MAPVRKHPRPHIAMRHRVLGGVFLVVGLGSAAAALLIARYLLAHFQDGHAWEALTGGAVCLVLGVGFLVLAWQQWVLEPKRQARDIALCGARNGLPLD